MVNLIDICITQKKKIKIALAKGKCHFIKALVFPKDRKTIYKTSCLLLSHQPTKSLHN